MTYKLFSDANCTVQVGSNLTKTSTRNPYTTPSPTHVGSAGTYHWIANYGGDANNNATSNVCKAANENVVINPLCLTVTTNASGPFTLGVDGNDLTDSATLAGASTNTTGTMTFKLFS